MNNIEFYKDENGVSEFPLNCCQDLHVRENVRIYEETGIKKGYGNAGVGIRIKMKLDYAAFEKAVNRVVNENDQLRAICVKKDDAYYQKIIKHVDFKLNVIEAEGNTLEEKTEYAMKKAREIAEKGFDIFNELSYEMVIIKISDEDNIFMTSAHHWIGDGTSIGIINNEIMKYYLHPETPVENKPMFIDYIKEIEEFVKTPKGIKQREYWDKEFEGYEPFDFNKIDMGTPSDGVDKGFPLSAASLDKVAEKYKVTRFSVFHMALHVVISLFTGKYDTSIGATSANRSLKYMKCVGFFARPVPIRLTIKDDNDKLADLLEITAKKFSKGLSYLKAENKFDCLQFTNPYQNFIPSSRNIKNEVEFEKIKFPIERKFNVGFIQVVEVEENIMVLISGNGNIVTEDLIKALKTYLPVVFDVLAEDENGTVADVKKRCGINE